MLVAPGAFKGAISAVGAARAIAAGWRLRAGGVPARELPVADGGPGTTDALVGAAGGITKVAHVLDPLGRPVSAAFGLLPGGAAVLELAAASGYELLEAHERDPERTGSFGTGELIRAALDHAPRRIVIGVGGSATNDAGLGALRALGARLLDDRGRELTGVGADLARLAHIDRSALDARLAEVDVVVACDVDSVFCGPSGAARVFAAQKGADPAAVERLDAGLAHVAALLERECGVAVAEMAHAGAAGGAAGGFAALLGARLAPGAAAVLDAISFDEHLADAALVVTGEGCLDAQTLTGKAPAVVAARARAAGVPCVALCGRIELPPGRLRDAGFSAAFPITRAAAGRAEAMAEAERDLAAAAASLAGLLAVPAG